MSDAPGAPILVFSPFVSSTMRVEPAWIDYNGHLNMAYYLVLFDRAIDEAFAVLGLGPDYVEARGMSYFTVETHTTYRRELSVDERVRATVQLVDHDDKRVHAYLELRQATEGWLSATCEKLFLHVDMASRKVCPFPDDIAANLASAETAHARLKRPEAIGRSITLTGRRRPPTQDGAATTRH